MDLTHFAAQQLYSQKIHSINGVYQPDVYEHLLLTYNPGIRQDMFIWNTETAKLNPRQTTHIHEQVKLLLEGDDAIYDWAFCKDKLR